MVLLRPWLTDQSFLSGMAISQILPGANVTNMAVYIGQKLRGVPGAFVALFGLIIGPFFAVIALSSAFNTIKTIPWAQDALDGVAAAAIGLLLTICFKATQRAARKLRSLLALLATFVAVGVLKLPFIPVVIVVGALSVTAAWLRKDGHHA